MESRTIAYALYSWVVVAVATGSVLIVFGTTLMARIGTVIIILGLISLMPAFSFLWWDEGPDDTDDPAVTDDSVQVTDATDDSETS